MKEGYEFDLSSNTVKPQNNLNDSEFADIYIRFGKIPNNEQSNMKQHSVTIGKEIGVSCYHAFFDKGKYLPIIPVPCTEDTLCTLDYCLNESSKGLRPVYLIIGDEVGIGADKEPLLRNIKIVADISEDYIGMYTD